MADTTTTYEETTTTSNPAASAQRAVEKFAGESAATLDGKTGCCGGGCGCGPKTVSFEEQVRAVIEKVRPFLQMDGGDIELIAIEDNNALVRLHGACTSCSISDVHMKMGVEVAIKRDIPEFGELIVID
ncbi:MAG: NifU family protein [bacterium]|nr:NifU family protein [bacterium]